MSSSGDQNTKQEQISSKHSKEAVAYKFWQEFQEERKSILLQWLYLFDNN